MSTKQRSMRKLRHLKIGKVYTNELGFESVLIPDAYADQILLEQSAVLYNGDRVPGASAVTLARRRIGVTVPERALVIHRKQVVRLIAALQQWVSTGSFKE